MKDLYFTGTNPHHNYKSEQFFDLYFKLRRRSGFGARVRSSAFKKKLIIKKFFMWYYFVPTKRIFVKLFHKMFLTNVFSFRRLTALLHLLERNLLVLLVRTQVCTNLLLALYTVKAGMVFVNVFAPSRAFYATHIGDFIEILPLFTLYI